MPEWAYRGFRDQIDHPLRGSQDDEIVPEVVACAFQQSLGDRQENPGLVMAGESPYHCRRVVREEIFDREAQQWRIFKVHGGMEQFSPIRAGTPFWL